MLSIRRFHLTFYRFFCKIMVYKGKWRLTASLGCCLALLCGGCRGTEPPSSAPSPTALQGVWLSYIELDEMLEGADPQSAADAIAAAMERCAEGGLNAVFFHLRAHGDAYYPSAVWPAATAAKAVMAEGFDPLATAVEEAHKRGIALHGWINPYRVGAAPAADGNCFQKDGTWYYDPAAPAARQSVLDGVREILDHYAVDGIHFDDYFYPPGMAAEGEAFESIPDGADVTLWRQTQVDALVSGTYSLCHQRGRLFGVSPAADTRRNRKVLYADVTRWMTEAGYIDYICPQLYVGFRHQTKPFDALLAEWASLPRREGVALYAGLALYKVGMTHDPYAGSGADEWSTDADIIPRQIEASKTVTDGYVLFRYGNLEI